MKESLCQWPVNFASRPSSALQGEGKDLDKLLPFVSIPPSCTKSQTSRDGKLESNKKSTIAENN